MIHMILIEKKKKRGVPQGSSCFFERHLETEMPCLLALSELLKEPLSFLPLQDLLAFSNGSSGCGGLGAMALRQLRLQSFGPQAAELLLRLVRLRLTERGQRQGHEEKELYIITVYIIILHIYIYILIVYSIYLYATTITPIFEGKH